MSGTIVGLRGAAAALGLSLLALAGPARGQEPLDLRAVLEAARDAGALARVAERRYALIEHEDGRQELLGARVTVREGGGLELEFAGARAGGSDEWELELGETKTVVNKGRTAAERWSRRGLLEGDTLRLTDQYGETQELRWTADTVPFELAVLVLPALVEQLPAAATLTLFDSHAGAPGARVTLRVREGEAPGERVVELTGDGAPTATILVAGEAAPPAERIRAIRLGEARGTVIPRREAQELAKRLLEEAPPAEPR